MSSGTTILLWSLQIGHIYCIPLLTAILNEDLELLFSLVQNSYLGLQYSLDCLFAKFIIETRFSICCRHPKCVGVLAVMCIELVEQPELDAKDVL